MPKRISQQTIADELGISRITVTKVLNGDHRYPVAAGTRERILNLARKMGYQPRRRRTGNIAFVVCGPLCLPEQGLYMDICEEASRLQQHVFLVNTASYPSYAELSASVNRLRVDGAVILGYVSASVLERLNGDIPVVIFGEYPPAEGMDRVMVDSRRAGREMAEYLIGLGHRDIALIIHSLEISMLQSVYEGYRSALEAAGLPFREAMLREKERCFYPDFIRNIMEADTRPTAMIACTPDDHPVILSILVTLGYSIPRDISYIGWGSLDFASMEAFPTLTCLEKDSAALARKGIRRLYDRIERGSLPPKEIMVTIDICKGETCAKNLSSGG